MKRKILTIVLSMSLSFSHAIPAFAENPDNVENEMAIEQTSEVEENQDIIADTDKAMFAEPSDADMGGVRKVNS